MARGRPKKPAWEKLSHPQKCAILYVGGQQIGRRKKFVTYAQEETKSYYDNTKVKSSSIKLRDMRPGNYGQISIRPKTFDALAERGIMQTQKKSRMNGARYTLYDYEAKLTKYGWELFDPLARQNQAEHDRVDNLLAELKVQAEKESTGQRTFSVHVGMHRTHLVEVISKFSKQVNVTAASQEEAEKLAMDLMPDARPESVSWNTYSSWYDRGEMDKALKKDRNGKELGEKRVKGSDEYGDVIMITEDKGSDTVSGKILTRLKEENKEGLRRPNQFNGISEYVKEGLVAPENEPIMTVPVKMLDLPVGEDGDASDESGEKSTVNLDRFSYLGD